MIDEIRQDAEDEGWGRKILKAVIGTSEEAGAEQRPADDVAVPAATEPAPPEPPLGVIPGGQSPQIDTLIRLIGDLPAEVNRKTGAAIVHKTMSAMGVSVADLLQDISRAKSSLLHEIELHRKGIVDCKRQIAEMELAIETSLKKVSQLDEVLELFKQAP